MVSGKTQRVRSSVRLAILEGIPSAAILGIIGNFVVPCALALKASAFQVGLVGAVPNVGAAVAQIKAPGLVDRMKSPRQVLIIVTLLGALPWLAMAAVVPFGSMTALWLLIAFSMMALLLYYLPNAAWGSWISALTPARMRGRILGVRAGVASIATIFVFLAGGVLLDLTGSRVLIGFAAIFAGAAVLRVLSYVLFTRMYEPPKARRAEPAPSLRAVARGLSRNSMGRFMAYFWLFMFGASLSGPFFTVYLLNDLDYSYIRYTIITLIPSLAGALAPYLFGRWADRRGNIVVLHVVSWGAAVVPFLWILSPATWWIVVIQLSAGAMWAGLNLIAVNHVYVASTPGERTSNIACLYMGLGVAVFTGNLIGGAIASSLPALNGNNLFTLFAISGGVRCLAALVFLPMVKDRPMRSRPPTPGLARRLDPTPGDPAAS